MSNETKVVPEMTSANAILLLDAAESLGLGPEVVRVISEGFEVPAAVAAEAGFEDDTEDQGLNFSSKAEAKAYAEANELDVDESLRAEEYKAAVVEAAQSKGA